MDEQTSLGDFDPYNGVYPFDCSLYPKIVATRRTTGSVISNEEYEEYCKLKNENAGVAKLD